MKSRRTELLAPFSRLCEDELLHIGKFLRARDWVNFSMVSRETHAVMEDVEVNNDKVYHLLNAHGFMKARVSHVQHLVLEGRKCQFSGVSRDLILSQFENLRTLRLKGIVIHGDFLEHTPLLNELRITKCKILNNNALAKSSSLNKLVIIGGDDNKSHLELDATQSQNLKTVELKHATLDMKLLPHVENLKIESSYYNIDLSFIKNLKSLEVSDVWLRKITIPPNNQLENLVVEKCDARGLDFTVASGLKSLKLYKCWPVSEMGFSKLDHLVSLEIVDCDMKDVMLELQSLKKLFVAYCPNFEGFKLPVLEQLVVKHCDGFKDQFASDVLNKTVIV